MPRGSAPSDDGPPESGPRARAFAPATDLVGDHLVEIRKVASVVFRHARGRLQLDDLVAAGFVALAETHRRHPGAPPDELRRLAAKRIHGAMMDELRGLDPVSRHARARLRRIERCRDRLTRELGRRVTEDEVSRCAELTLDAYHAAVATAVRVVDVELDEVSTQASLPDPETAVASEELGVQLRVALRALPARLSRVLHLYYVDGRTLREIGGELGVGEARVSQLVSAAILELRAAFAAATLPSLGRASA